MEIDRSKVLSAEDVLNLFGRTDLLPVKIERDFLKKLRTNLIIPSSHQAFSMCVEYMTKWFYSKFPDNFFRTTFLDASNILDKLRTLSNKQLIGSQKPCAAIVADIDMNYNRQNIDLHNLGLNLYSNHCNYRDAFFIDKKNHLFISLCTELLLMNFTFKIRLDTRALQLDVAKMCQMAFRANGTQKHYNDVDYPVPKELIQQIACDAGYCITNNNIYDRIQFMHYLNMHSKLPFFYKLNTSTQNMEWFIKIPNIIVHIQTNDVNLDQGNTKGMTYTDYGVTFDCQVRFPSPKFYAYYSIVARESIKSVVRIDDGIYMQAYSNLAKIAEIDEHGWQWMVHTDFTFTDSDDIEKIKHKSSDLQIKFDQLIGDLRNVIDYTKSIAISPEVFLNIKVFNFDNIVKSHIDWQKYIIHIDEPIQSLKCFLIVYMDNSYLHENLSNIKHYEENRIQPSDNIVGPEMEEKVKTPNASSSMSILK